MIDDGINLNSLQLVIYIPRRSVNLYNISPFRAMDLKFFFVACFVTFLGVEVVESTAHIWNPEGDASIPLVKLPREPVLREGDTRHRERRSPPPTELGIIGGHTTNITQHPYQVAILSGDQFICSGALLNRIWVLALASCTQGARAAELSVRAGSSSNTQGGALHNVTQVVLHPGFNYTNEDYDFALLKLQTYLCFNKQVGRISLSGSAPDNDDRGVVSGWGSHGDNSSGDFRQLEMRVIKNSWCQDDYSVTGDHITPRMLCAVAHHSGPCFNDFGDPLVVDGELAGLYSWSRGCANPNYPAVFSNVAAVVDWIYDVMDNSCSCGIY